MENLSLALFATLTLQTANQPVLQPWVQQASAIKVISVDESRTIMIPIDDGSTIEDVKQLVEDCEKVPVCVQILREQYKNWWTIGLFNTNGAVLSDDQNVKQVMNRTNSSCLKLEILKVKVRHSIERARSKV